MSQDKLQQAIKDSAQHWYSNWALLSGKPEGVAVVNNYVAITLSIGRYATVNYSDEHCPLCTYCGFLSGCDKCPLGSCGMDSLWRDFNLAAKIADLPAMIRAARALYEKLDSLVEEDIDPKFEAYYAEDLAAAEEVEE